MQVAYSIFDDRPKAKATKSLTPAEEARERRYRLMKAKSVQSVLRSHQKEIEFIRTIFPGWMPGDKI
jgi:hypothetical protein